MHLTFTFNLHHVFSLASNVKSIVTFMLFGLPSTAEDLPKVTQQRAVCSYSLVDSTFCHFIYVWNYTELVQKITARLIGHGLRNIYSLPDP